MSCKALVTLDLLDASNNQRDAFYEVLVEEKWIKIKNLTTAWRISFAYEATRELYLKTLKKDLIKAKERSEIDRVNYAIQIDIENVIEDYI